MLWTLLACTEAPTPEDTGCTEARFSDADGDGHGDASRPAPGCEGVRSDDDCDDADPTVYPGAPELCDGVDNGCAGAPEAGLATLDGEDVSEELALGSAETPALVFVDGELSLCEGTWYLLLRVPVEAAIRGRGAVVVDGAGRGPVLQVEGHAVVEDLEIRGGVAEEGGGILVNGSAELARVTVTENLATGYGGGICSRGPLRVEDSFIAENESGYVGGGLLALSDLTLLGSTVEANRAVGGAGIYVNDGAVEIRDCTLQDNVADPGVGGALLAYGQAGSHPELSLERVAVRGNSAVESGGGIALRGESAMTAEECTIEDNSAGEGGGLWVEEAAATLRGGTLAGNRATFWGGGALVEGSLTLEGVEVADNLPEDVWAGGACVLEGAEQSFEPGDCTPP